MIDKVIHSMKSSNVLRIQVLLLALTVIATWCIANGVEDAGAAESGVGVIKANAFHLVNEKDEVVFVLDSVGGGANLEFLRGGSVSIAGATGRSQIELRTDIARSAASEEQSAAEMVIRDGGGRNRCWIRVGGDGALTLTAADAAGATILELVDNKGASSFRFRGADGDLNELK
jgi:hypothetical protein